MATEEAAIPSKFYKNVVTILTIGGTGFFVATYLENSFKNSIKETISPYVQKVEALEKRVDDQSNQLTTLKEKSSLNDYRWDIYENQIKDFLKPEGVRIQNKSKKEES